MPKKVYLLSFFIFFVSYSFSQSNINQFDSEGKRHGNWKKLYSNGNIRYKGVFSHGKEIGIFKFYNVTGEKSPRVTKTYKLTATIVDVQFFSKKGIIESKGQMQDKKRVGKWMYFFKDGKTILSTENYKNGFLEGKFQIFYKNGKLTELAHYKNGKLNGKRIRYSDDGETTEDITYQAGIMHGPAIIYDEKGEIYSKGNYTDGIKTGIWEFNMDGVMVKTTPDKIKYKN